MKLEIKKTGINSYAVVGGIDYDKAKKWKIGQSKECDVKEPRNYQFHKKFFALVGLCFDNLPEEYDKLFPTPEKLLDELKFQVGHCENHQTIGGKVIPKTKSINFASMDQYEFQEFYDSVLNVILKYFMVGVEKRDIAEMIAVEF